MVVKSCNASFQQFMKEVVQRLTSHGACFYVVSFEFSGTSIGFGFILVHHASAFSCYMYLTIAIMSSCPFPLEWALGACYRFAFTKVYQTSALLILTLLTSYPLIV